MERAVEEVEQDPPQVGWAMEPEEVEPANHDHHHRHHGDHHRNDQAQPEQQKSMCRYSACTTQ